MKRINFDIETLFSCFTVSFLDYDSDQVMVFEISRRTNQLREIKHFWKGITHLISFNGVHFDQPVMGWLLAQPWEDKNGEWVAREIYKVAQEIITGDEFEIKDKYRKYTYFDGIQIVDLFLYWSKMLRLSKKLSLKFFALNLGMDIVEMPIHHTQQYLTDEEIESVREYNVQDVKVTKRLAQELQEQINLRVWIQQEYGIKGALSMDAPKIASEVLLKAYCEATGKDPREVRKRRYYKPRIYLKNILPKVTFKTPFFQQIYRDMQNSVDTFSREYLYKNPNKSYLKLSYGVGGIHSIQSNQSYQSTAEKQVWTSDVSSLYPTLLIEYGYLSPELGLDLLRVYSNIKQERLEAKKSKQKTKDSLLKLVLNSTSGLLDNQHHWLYSPEQVLALRLHGQLLLSRLTEECGLHGINVISLNTDGIELILSPLQKVQYNKILETIEKEFRVEFESEQYQFIKYLTVNDYIALTISGKVKVKGSMNHEWVLDGSNEFLVIPKALKAYFVDGIPVEKFIREHQNIYDFTCGKKVDKKYTVHYRGTRVQQLNRYFISTKAKGAYLYKQKGKKGKMENLLKGVPVYILNEETTKPASQFPIDYNAYITKAKEIIDLFEPDQLSVFGSTPLQQAA